MKKILINLLIVFKKPNYLLLSLIIGSIFYILNVLINNREGIIGIKQFVNRSGMLAYIGILIKDYHQTVDTEIFIVLLILSILFGILFTLIMYKTKVVSGIDSQKKGGLLASISFVLGLLASSCVACGIGLFSLLGIGAATLSFLPFGGIELSIIAILILLVSILQFSKNLFICKT